MHSTDVWFESRTSDLYLRECPYVQDFFDPSFQGLITRFFVTQLRSTLWRDSSEADLDVQVRLNFLSMSKYPSFISYWIATVLTIRSDMLNWRIIKIFPQPSHHFRKHHTTRVPVCNQSSAVPISFRWSLLHSVAPCLYLSIGYHPVRIDNWGRDYGNCCDDFNKEHGHRLGWWCCSCLVLY